MTLTKLTSSIALGAALLFSGSAGGAVLAAQADIDLLKSYLGEWRGRGSTTTANGTESVACRLSITDAGVEKVNYNGRCTLAGGTISIKGTMAFVTADNRYEAVMTSSTSFAGIAIGKRRGTGIDFDLRDRDTESGKEYAIAAGFELEDEAITLDFKVTEVETGRESSALIPFEK